jgi:hypothetical protein
MRHQPHDLTAHVVAADRVDVEPIEEPECRLDAGLLVIGRADAPVDERGRRWLAEVVADGTEHHRNALGAVETQALRHGFVHHHQRMDPHVALGVPFRLLLAADEWQKLWQQHRDDTQIERECEPD